MSKQRVVMIFEMETEVPVEDLEFSNMRDPNVEGDLVLGEIRVRRGSPSWNRHEFRYRGLQVKMGKSSGDMFKQENVQPDGGAGHVIGVFPVR